MRSLKKLQSLHQRRIYGAPISLPVLVRWRLALRARFAGQCSLSGGWLFAFRHCLILDYSGHQLEVQIHRLATLPCGLPHLRHIATLPVSLFLVSILFLIALAGAALGTALGHRLA